MMEREIKFEYGFKSVNGIVKKVYFLHEVPDINNKCDVWNVLPIKYVRQFTGLKDKNGTDIYEGDVLSVVSKSKSAKEFIGTVQFNHMGMFAFVCGDKYNNIESLKSYHDIEKIGNVH